MFTGIVEATGMITALEMIGTNHSFWIESSISPELKVDQSISHSGVCLTVDAMNEGIHRVTAIDETLRKTNLAEWQVGTLINLERCLKADGRLDGHMVQGHVDTTATCTLLEEKNGSWVYTFRFSADFAHLIIEKGSVCVNGISLTCFDISRDSFTVAIIPYTYKHTNIHCIKPGDRVNIEFDILGKYLARWQELASHN